LWDRALLERLDLALVSPDWLKEHPRVVVLHVVRLGSDHCPLLLDSDWVSKGGPKPFRYERFWVQVEGAKNVIKDAWRKPDNDFFFL
jgi:hypothetical protein